MKKMQLIEKLLYRIFDQLDREDMNPKNQTENSLYSLRSFLQALEGEVSGTRNAAANKMLQNAWKLFREAQRAMNDGLYRQAQTKISLSQRFANRVMMSLKVHDTVNYDEIKAQIADTRSLLDLQAQQEGITQDNVAAKMLQEAKHFLTMSENFLEQERPGLAFNMLQAATRLSTRIQRRLRRQDQVSVSAAETEALYKRVESILNRLSDNERVMKRHAPVIEQLRKMTEQGLKYLRNGQTDLANEWIIIVNQQIKQYANQWRK